MKAYTVLTCFLTLPLQPFWMSAWERKRRKALLSARTSASSKLLQAPKFQVSFESIPQLLACRNRYGIAALLWVNCFCFSGSELVSTKKTTSHKWLKQLHLTDFVWLLCMCAHAHVKVQPRRSWSSFFLALTVILPHLSYIWIATEQETYAMSLHLHQFNK